jgi:four helix bundle protein
MATYKKFEDMEVWQISREFVKNIYSVSNTGSFKKDPNLSNQIQRAGISIVSNIAEGFERGGNKEFKQFLSLAKGSAGEVRAQLYLAMDLGYIDTKLHEELNRTVVSISKMIQGFINYLSKSELKGAKFNTK